MTDPNPVFTTPRGEPAVRLDELPEDGAKIEQGGLRPAGAGVELTAPLTLRLNLLPEEGSGIAVVGGFEWKGMLGCSRCAETVEQAGKAEFAYFLVSAAESPKENDTHLEDGDMDIVYYESPELNLAEVAAEQLALAIPAKPLCRPDCKGLCPRCGQNLNAVACDCPPESVDPRLGAFDKIAADLFKKN